ncbi:MAG: 2-oxoacid:acceptor oxidoreductase family protein [Sulfolobales archaeon]|nr:2-oxoacid:acceptor oxidoreductase family protein [Sulfolobales archaeon]MDW8082601.1 2-oxoacid:acceptor oxidoreductase family protein [Sulfolobales archaeon]
MLVEVRWHGRGGQGAVTAAELVAYASIIKGYYALAFPEFGAERRGAPVTAYNRIADRVIYDRSPVLNPDAVVILDSSMVGREVLHGLKKGGFVVANTTKKPSELSDLLGQDYRYATINATKIALDVFRLPIVNTAMTAALAAASRVVDLEHLVEAVKSRFSARLASLNELVLRKAFELTEVK